MKSLLLKLQILFIVLFLIFFLPSCNNEELYVFDESTLIDETPPTEETPSNEDEITPINTVDDNFEASENSSIEMILYTNDENIPSTITLEYTNPSNGTLTVENNQTPDNLLDDIIIYTPDDDFFGTDSFTYTLCDALNEDNCDTATVTIVVNEVNTDDEFSAILKAFPTAEGAGANATGGRGGDVIHVTNLNDSGVGSLRWAIETNKTTPRTIVFDVSGTIVWNGPGVANGVKNLTIAGQTAPEGGITIQAPYVGFYRAENVIIRYIRFVNTQYFYNQQKSAAFNGSGANNLILDHCSMRYSWASPGFTFQDDNDTNNGQGDITVQRSIIGDNHTGGIVGAIVTDPRNALAGKNSVHHNLFVHVDHRFPNVSGNAEAEIVENVIYNYRARLSTMFNDSKTNLINNTYKAGPTSAFFSVRNKIGDYVDVANGDTPLVFSSGNRIIDPNNNHAPTDTDWQGLFVIWETVGTGESVEVTNATEERFRRYDEFPTLGIPITKLGTDTAYNSVLSDVGANAYLNEKGEVGRYLDENDSNYVNDVDNETCWSCQSNNELPNKTDISQLNYPTLPTNTRGENYDFDKDGMPDEWERTKFDDLTRDGKGDFDGDGYTDLEEFLNLVDFK